MTDTLATFVGLFSGTWNIANTNGRTPVFDKWHNKKAAQTGTDDFVLLSPFSDEKHERNAFGYATYDKEYFLAVDIFTSFSDDHSVLMREEAERVMNVLRLAFSQTGFHIIDEPGITDFRDGMRKVYRWKLRYPLARYNLLVNT